MRILNENSALHHLHPWSGRRAVCIATGVFLGAALSLHGFHPGQTPTAVVAESTARPSYGSAASSHIAKASAQAPDWHEIGLASWYGTEFQGKQTADGEAYNMHDLTCAHRFLPLGTWLKVTNMHTHRWIVVRVNDRGPVPDTRIADLSSEAARMLGMRNRGVTRVRLDVIDPKQAQEVARLDRQRLARLAAQADQASQASDGN